MLGSSVMALDPSLIINAIGAGLKLVDQFREMVLERKKGKAEPPSVTAEQAGDTIRLRDKILEGGKGILPPVRPIATSATLKLDEWDQARYDALYSRVKTNWDYFYELYKQEAGTPPETKARLKVNMDKVKRELCVDFRELVSIYQRTMGVQLPDHYSLYEVCG
jgi:hypothetical protein